MAKEANVACEVLDKGGAPLTQWYTVTEKERIVFTVHLKDNIGQLLESLSTFEVRHDDIWICGYPKSGNHWIYEIVSILMSNKLQVNDVLMENCFVEMQKSMEQYKDWPSPRLFVSHLPFERLPPKVKDTCKIIYPLRNPKSAAVSYYHHMKKYPLVGYNGEFHNFWPIYVEGITEGFLYGDWFTFTKSHWKECKQRPNMMVLPYEQLKKDTRGCIDKLCEFLDIERDQSFKDDVVRLTTMESLSNYQHKAEDQRFERKYLTQLIYRTGSIDDWKQHFTVADNELFDELYQDQMCSDPDLVKLIQFQ